MLRYATLCYAIFIVTGDRYDYSGWKQKTNVFVSCSIFLFVVVCFGPSLLTGEEKRDGWSLVLSCVGLSLDVGLGLGS
jgi:hypothetical protein